GPRGDRRRAPVEDRDADRHGSTGERGMWHVRLDVRQLEEAAVASGLRLTPDGVQDVVDPVAGAGGLAAMLTHDVVRVAVTLHVGRVRGHIDPRAVGGLLLVHEGVRAERLEAEL